MKYDLKKLKKAIKVDFSKVPMDQFRMGMNVELEHGSKDKATDVTHNDAIKTAKIVLAHIKEKKNYYTLLKKVEGKKK